MSEITDIYERNATITKVVQLKAALDEVKRITVDLRVNQRLGPEQQLVISAIETFIWADDITRVSGTTILVAKSGDGTFFRLDKML